MRGNGSTSTDFSLNAVCQVLSSDGNMRIVAPDSLLREQSSHPLRKLLVEKHSWNEVWAIEEANLLFHGMTQGVAIGVVDTKWNRIAQDYRHQSLVPTCIVLEPDFHHGFHRSL